MKIMTTRTVLAEEMPEHKAVILVTGPYDGGKSTFIQSISERVWPIIGSDEVTEYFTEAEDSIAGRCHMPVGVGTIGLGDDAAIVLMESPGARRWDVIFEMAGLTQGFAGVIVVFDSARPETFRETKSILETFRAYPGVPYVVAASKQDHREAWDVEDLSIALRLKDDVRLMPCAQEKRIGVKQVLLELVQKIPAERAIAKVRSLPDSGPPVAISASSDFPDPATSDSIRELVTKLQSSERRERDTAVRALGRLNDPRVIAPLKAVLKDDCEVWDIRCGAAQTLGELGDPGVEVLLAALQESDSWLRSAAALAFGGVRMAQALNPLIEALQDADDMLRWAAARALATPGNVRALRPLIHALNDPVPPVRAAAARSLGTLGDVNAVESLIAILNDPDQTVRWFATDSLGQLRDLRAVEPLIAVLQDTHSMVRDAAALALKNIGTPEALDAVRRWQEEHGG